MNSILKIIKSLITNNTFHFIFKLFTFLIVMILIDKQLEVSNLKKNFTIIEDWFILILFFIIVQSINLFLIVFRWKILLEISNKTSYRFKVLISPVLYGNLANSISILGSFFSRAILTSTKSIKLHSIATSIILEKSFSLFSLTLLSMLSLILLFFFNIINIQRYINVEIILIFYFIIFMLTLILIIFQKNIKRLIKNLPIFNYFTNYIDFRLIILPLILSFFIQLLGLISMVSICKLFETNISILNFILILTLIKFISSIPITFTQWGWRELIYINIFLLLGVNQNLSFLMSATYGIAILISSILFVLIFEISSKTK